jgi:hypothetical protein
MNFKRYPHIEKFGHIEVEGIDIGQVHIFPKIDGTNASLWLDQYKRILAGSRKRELSEDADNAGFYNWILLDETGESDPYIRFLEENPHLRLYGEWLVPHTFKGYRDEAWHKFYVFDIYDHNTNKFLHYIDIVTLASKYKFTYIPVLAIIDDPTEKQLIGCMNSNTYLCKDAPGNIGEGIVLKRYDFVNKFNNTTWAKMVRAEFKDRHLHEMPPKLTHGALTVERDTINKYVTEAFVKKERAKIELSLWNAYTASLPEAEAIEACFHRENQDRWLASRECRKVLIPRLLQTVFYELIKEHAWDFGGKPKTTVDFKKLNVMVIQKVKEFNKDLF